MDINRIIIVIVHGRLSIVTFALGRTV